MTRPGLRTPLNLATALLALALIRPGAAVAQQPFPLLRDDVDERYTHDSWSIREGLPQNTVNAIVQTRDGYLWLATFAGLMRFDGVRFTVFEMATADGLASNRILALFEDRRGRLWIGHEQNGVTVMESGVFTTIEHPILSQTLVWAFAQDHAGHVWAATELGLFRLGGSGVAQFTRRDGLPTDELTSLLVDRDGILWVGTKAGVVRFADGELTPMTPVTACPREVSSIWRPTATAHCGSALPEAWPAGGANVSRRSDRTAARCSTCAASSRTATAISGSARWKVWCCS